MNMNFTTEALDTVILREREDSCREHRVLAVTIETPFTVEYQRVPTTIHPGDPDWPENDDRCYIETTYGSWGVWDSRSADWARCDGFDGQHFDSKGEAFTALKRAMPELLA